MCEPGVYYRDFEKETLKKGLILPSYPASRNLCAIGGMVSNNSGGELTLQYGKTNRYVRELDIVLRGRAVFVLGIAGGERGAGVGVGGVGVSPLRRVLPIAGDPLNHAALLSTTQVDAVRAAFGLTAETEWDRFDPDSAPGRLCAAVGGELAPRRSSSVGLCLSPVLASSTPKTCAMRM